MTRAVVLCLAVALYPTLAASQSTDASRWGVAAGFIPEFNISGSGSAMGKLAEVMFEQGDVGLDVKGGDFRIGVVRGRRLGGEWGVSYVRRSFKEESRQGGTETNCFTNSFNNSTLCQTAGTEYLYGSDVALNGIEANRFFVFTTIKSVVQIGLDLGGGVGWMKGTAIERNTDPQSGNFNPPANSTINIPTVITDTPVPASTLVTVDPVPIGRVELAAGFILGNYVKVRASGGFTVPGTHVFNVTASVFFR